MDPTDPTPIEDSNTDIPITALAALLANDVSIDWILAFSDERPSAVLASLNEAVREGILVQKENGVYAFAGHEERTKCLSVFSEEEKAVLHRRLAEQIPREFPEETEVLPVLAQQLLSIADGLEDYVELLETGEALRRSYHQEDALSCYERVIRDLGSARGREADRLFVHAAMGCAAVHSIYDDPKWIIATVKEAISRSKGAGTHPFQVLLKMHLAKFEWFQGRQATAILEFNDAWAMVQASEDLDLRRRTATFRMSFSCWQGRFQEVVQAYEEGAAALSRYPRSVFPIIATNVLGESLSACGRVSEGLGMLDGLYDHCREIGNNEELAGVLLSIARTFLFIERVNEAILILEEVQSKHADRMSSHNRSLLHRFYAAAFALKKDYRKAVSHIREIDALGVTVFARNVFVREDGLIRMAVGMEEDELLTLSGRTSEQIVQSAVKDRNIHARGMGYLFRARLLMKKKSPEEDVVSALKLSIKWLEISGHKVQLSKARIDLSRAHLRMGNRTSARIEAQKAYDVLASLNPSLIPEDLSPVLDDLPAKDELLNKILSLSQEITTIRDNRELAMHILASIGKLAGIERGGIFLLDQEGNGPGITLDAAKNLTRDHIDRPSFRSSMDIIGETVSSGIGRIMKMTPDDSAKLQFGERRDAVLTIVCVPIVLKGETIGALYGDNRVLESPLKESDLNAFSFLAGQWAIAHDNARAYEEIQQLNQQLVAEKQYYMEKDLQQSQFKNFIGNSPAMQRVFDQINRVADRDTVVLIQGETGVGKELVARTIQNQSRRKEKAFISADCSALSETIITSELFGHEKGAFTGAQSRRIGRFELAHGGTLFLDEIGNIPAEIQVRLLRVLQTKEFQRVGGIETIRSDFRLITASNKDLDKEAAAGRFREDLYYRLNVFPIIVPPLRERREDIPLLALHFLRSYSDNTGNPSDGISKQEMEKLLQYPWPGNVRELQSVIERGVILSSGSRFKVPELTAGLRPNSEREMITLAENERRHILWVLEQTGGKITGKNGAARHLGLPDSTLYSRMKKLGIKSASAQAP